MVVYLLVTSAMIYMLPMRIMAGSSLVATDATDIAFGAIGGGFIAALICLSVLGATNGSVYTSPRLTFAMAEQKQFFSAAAIVHKKYQTPGNAFLFNFLWMLILVLSGSFYILADMYIFVVWLFNLMLVWGIFILRKKMPAAERPYKVWGYPWLPILVLMFTVFYLGITLYNDIHNYFIGKSPIMNSVFGIILTALGIPLFYYFKKKEAKSK
jgi:basic amino acid/polyamine antiporter, APA family